MESNPANKMHAGNTIDCTEVKTVIQTDTESVTHVKRPWPSREAERVDRHTNVHDTQRPSTGPGQSRPMSPLTLAMDHHWHPNNGPGPPYPYDQRAPYGYHVNGPYAPGLYNERRDWYNDYQHHRHREQYPYPCQHGRYTTGWVPEEMQPWRPPPHPPLPPHPPPPPHHHHDLNHPYLWQPNPDLGLYGAHHHGYTATPCPHCPPTAAPQPNHCGMQVPVCCCHRHAWEGYTTRYGNMVQTAPPPYTTADPDNPQNDGYNNINDSEIEFRCYRLTHDNMTLTAVDSSPQYDDCTGNAEQIDSIQYDTYIPAQPSPPPRPLPPLPPRPRQAPRQFSGPHSLPASSSHPPPPIRPAPHLHKRRVHKPVPEEPDTHSDVDYMSIHDLTELDFDDAPYANGYSTEINAKPWIYPSEYTEAIKQYLDEEKKEGTFAVTRAKEAKPKKERALAVTEGRASSTHVYDLLVYAHERIYHLYIHITDTNKLIFKEAKPKKKFESIEKLVRHHTKCKLYINCKLRYHVNYEHTMEAD